MAPAPAIDDLLVGQHGSAFRTPVHPAILAIGEVLFKELNEKPLVPFVVVRQAGRHFARPVVGEPEAAHLRLHGGNVAQRPFARRGIVLNGGIFCRQSEGIPTHGMKNVVTVHPHVTRKGIADRIISHVPHVKRARGIGQHFEDVILGLRGMRLGRVKRGILLPALGPFRLDAVGVVANLGLLFAANGCLFFRRHRF